MPARGIAAVIAAVSIGTLTGCSASHARASTASRGWQVRYDGYGEVRTVSRDGVVQLTLRPAPPASGSSTHAALVLSRRSWRDFTVTIRLRTSRQLRQPDPNPWEVGWLLWHYANGSHFYYVLLKPNGWELGKEDPAYPGMQRYLATGTRPRFPIGSWYSVHVGQHGSLINVSVNGRPLVHVDDTHAPYLSGRFGCYVEEASATYEPISVEPR